jgi:hypothetical protein
MELRYVPPELGALDGASAELVLCPVWSDVRPFQGLAGLADFRLAGRLSWLAQRGFVTGAEGEAVLLPGRPKLPFSQLVLVGAGVREAFDEVVLLAVVERLLRIAAGLGASSCVVELPGRADGLVTPERAAELLLGSVGREREEDVWTLVEDGAARDRITTHLREARRRVRRIE